MKKYALFAFNGEAVCFLHVLLNGIDLASKGSQVAIVIEGAATGLLPAFVARDGVGQGHFDRALKAGLIDCACTACAGKMGGTEAAKQLGIPLKGEMSGHPAMAGYLDEGYSIITF